jgi:Zn-dependent M28 family amino/carboxypeptidase
MLLRSSHSRLLVTTLLLGTPLIAQPAPSLAPANPESATPADPRFSADRVKADVAFLSDDLLEGRDTGSRGHEIAALYVAQRFASLGLKPMGDDGGWQQRITFQKTERIDAAAGITVIGRSGSQTFDQDVDSLVGLNANAPKLNVSAPLVFVGYGMENTRLGMHDYDGLDVSDKIVVTLRGFPADLPSEAAAYASALTTKGEAALAHGAIGIIEIDTETTLKQRPWAKRLSMAFQPKVTWVAPDGKAFDDLSGIRVTADADDKVAEAIFAGAPRTLAKLREEAARKGGRPRGFALKTSARVFGESKSNRITSSNVVAMLPGSDLELAGQYVILSGHLDHLGITPAKPGDPVNKDRINNGALDNAAGVATTLEVARVMAQDNVKPRRSVIFLITTGEEKGLLGADYYAHNPTVPITRIVGNVDLDMPLLLYPFTDVVAFGAEHSTLGQEVANALKPMKVSLAPDPMPEERIFVRSDHFRFVKQGIPAVFLATGFANGGAAAWQDFLANYYHQPDDDMNQALDWQAGARFAEANYRVTRTMADSDVPPLWYKGDFFGDLFAPNAAKSDKPR